MKITMIGTGYVGLVTGTCLAEVGNDVLCLDVDAHKIDVLTSGGVPIHEPGLEPMIHRNVAAGRLRFTTDVDAAVGHADVQFIAVGTPPDEDGSADMRYVLQAARNIGRRMTQWTLVVDKSTVPVGTGDRVQTVIAEELAARGVDVPYAVASNPEFLKEGAAVEDFMRPDRIVIGTDDTPAGLRARDLMKLLYAPFNRNHERVYWMDVRSAEFTKYAANAMLATRISFMNELANLADQVGADHDAVRTHEVFHRGALFQELRVRDHGIVDGYAPFFQLLGNDRFHFVGGAYGHGALVHHHLVILHVAPDARRRAQHVLEVGRAVLAGRGADGDELDRAVRDRALDVGGEVQPARGHVARHHLVEAGLVDRQPAALQGGDLVRVDVQAQHVVAHVGEAGAGNQPDVARADDGDFHSTSSITW